MEPFTTLCGIAAPLDRSNVDTDAIVPKQFLKVTGRAGLARALFHDLRREGDFVLDRPAWQGASILVTGANFGCGSSREHAVWALMDAGIRCVVAPSFAEIFSGNCVKNGLLAVALPQPEVDRLMDDARRGADARLTVDLVAQEILRPDGERIRFEIDAHARRALLEGLDDIALTLGHESEIGAFEARRKAQTPWL
ncbi:MAG: 3-isopropylmalate dehydratase small subunit [Alphaproteobacteria bacterium]|nr:3-isopropylmalate dehydratase small subunit [Alphaproteobacteria bacterium]